MKLSIIIPVYNERKTVGELLERVHRVRLPGVVKEVLVIDDGSIDGSLPVLKTLTKRFGYRLYRHAKNCGKGAAIRTGLKHATGQWTLIQDADLEYDPAQWHRLIEGVRKDSEAAWFGSRFLGKEYSAVRKQTNVRLSNYLANRFLTWLTNCLFRSSLTDMETCLKLLPTVWVKQFALTENAFGIEPEITAKLLKSGVRIREVAIDHRPRSYAEGKKIRWHDGIVAILVLFRVRLFWTPR